MPRRPSERSPSRASARLSHGGIVAAGIALADRDGLDGLSMRRLAQDLGVDAMSIYHHLRDKNALLAAMADSVVAEIAPVPDSAPSDTAPSDTAPSDTAPSDTAPSDTAPSDTAWTEQLRALVMAARHAVMDHPWAARVLQDSESPTPAVLRHIERVLAILRAGGCSVDLGHHALHLLGSRILGFSQDLFDDSPDTRPAPDVAAAQVRQWAETHPHIAELAAAVSHQGALGGCDDDAEFEFAIDVLLEGLERRRRAESGP